MEERFKKYLETHFDELFKDRIEKLFKEFRNKPRIFHKDRVILAKDCCINDAHFNTNSGKITIEDYVMLGWGVELHAGTHDIRKFNRERYPFPSSGCDILVKKGAAIFSNALILGPCTIGEHAVVAAGAVVAKDVPPYAVVMGNPAVIKYYLDKPKET